MTTRACVVLMFCVAVGIGLSAACGRDSPAAPSPPPVPNFQGEFAGTYVIDSCVEAGAFFSGFCFGSGSTPGGPFALELSLTQNQTAVSGTVILSRSGGTPLSRGTA